MRTSRLLLTLTAVAISGLVSAKDDKKEEFSLDRLSPLSRSDVTQACYDTYTAPIAGCGGGRGGGGGGRGGGGGGRGHSSASCSDTCVSSLNKSEAAVRSACRRGLVSVDDLLRRIVDGANLANIVCPDYELEFSESTLVADDLAATLVDSYSAMLSPHTTVDPNAEIAVDTRPAPTPPTAVTTATSAVDLDPAPSPTVLGASASDGASPSSTGLPSGASPGVRRNSAGAPLGLTVLVAVIWCFS